MRTILTRILLTRSVTLVCIAAVAASIACAQNSDLGLLVGASFRVNGRVSPGLVTGRTSAAGQINYAIQLHEGSAGQLYLELPVVIAGGVEGRVGGGAVVGSVRNTVFFTPGARWKFTPASRVSFYAAAGAGLASFGQNYGFVGNGVVLGSVNRVTTGALGFGGGIDVRLTRLVSLRAEVRDGVTRGNIDGSANHAFVMAGAALHF
jgi:hypothetical protein